MESILEEVLIKIFTYLKIADKRSCRLVCQKWYSCCESKIITRTEKFVFNSRIYTPSEVNKFLKNLDRKGIHVEFIHFNLLELNFASFGEKIGELEIDVYCPVEKQRKSLKNLFSNTPNMTSLRLTSGDAHDSNGFDFDGEVIQELKVGEIIDFLREEKFSSAKLKKFRFKMCKEIKERIRNHAFPISYLYSVFPSLNTITWEFLPWKDFEKFVSISTLTSFDLTIQPSDYSLSEKILSRATALQTLNVFLDTGDQDLSKKMLFQILTNCSKLTYLKFSTSKSSICLDGREETERFFSLISNLRSIEITRVIVHLDSEQPTTVSASGPLKTLHVKDTCCGPSDLHPRLLSANQLTSLHLEISELLCEKLYDYITEILRCQTLLREFTINVKESGDECFKEDSKTIRIRQKHDRLNDFKLLVTKSSTFQPNHLMNWLSKWKFPNLETLKLFTPCIPKFESDPFLAETAKLEIRRDVRNHYMKWLKTLPKLTEIDVGLNFMDSDNYIQICSRMKNLQKIVWRRSTRILESKEIINVFSSLPRLRLLHIPVVMKTFCEDSRLMKYHYCRSKKKLVRL